MCVCVCIYIHTYIYIYIIYIYIYMYVYIYTYIAHHLTCNDHAQSVVGVQELHGKNISGVHVPYSADWSKGMT